MHWGAASWTLIHGLACLLPDDPQHASWLFNWFISLIEVIPCHECKRHAEHMLTNQRYHIRTLPQLKDALWQFHNTINYRSGKAFLPRDRYEDIHSRGNIFRKIHNFELAMRRSSRGRRDFMQGMVRSRITNRLVANARQVCISLLA